MAFLEIDFVDIDNNYDELREWMDNHGLADHALIGGLETFVIKKDDIIVAVIQERPAKVYIPSIDTNQSAACTYRIGQLLSSVSQYSDGFGLMLLNKESPSYNGARKSFRCLGQEGTVFVL